MQRAKKEVENIACKFLNISEKLCEASIFCIENGVIIQNQNHDN